MPGKICSIVGARPQFVKAWTVSRALLAQPSLVEVMIHTGQHYDDAMSEIFFREFALPRPRYDLGVGSASHAAQTARMLEGIERILQDEAPRAVMVYGDTNSTLAGALAAAKLRIPVVHVEAGLRSFNRAMPEEINRIVVDAVSDLLLAPTDHAVRQLEREGQPADRIVRTGDVMYDAALMMADVARARSTIVEVLGLRRGGYYLATVHRAENTDDPARLRAVFGALVRVAEHCPVVLPLHPRTRAALAREGMLDSIGGAVTLIDPVGFVDMVRLEMDARAIISDSGGVQKEAFFFGVRCFVLRDETEWVELVEAGWNVLIGAADPAAMTGAILSATALPPLEGKPYGDGHAADVIAGILARRFGDTQA